MLDAEVIEQYQQGKETIQCVVPVKHLDVDMSTMNKEPVDAQVLLKAAIEHIEKLKQQIWQKDQQLEVERQVLIFSVCRPPSSFEVAIICILPHVIACSVVLVSDNFVRGALHLSNSKS